MLIWLRETHDGLRLQLDPTRGSDRLNRKLRLISKSLRHR
jgi:hypothetical protein